MARFYYRYGNIPVSRSSLETWKENPPNGPLKTIIKYLLFCVFFLPSLVFAESGQVHQLPSNYQEYFSTSTKQAIFNYADKYAFSPYLAMKIMYCESTASSTVINKNLNSSGEVWSRDYSWWQLNDYYQAMPIAKLGWDIQKPVQNLEAGFYIASNSGLSPWNASRSCWATF